ncbi:MAG TPA: hypothetical protein VF447_05665 [Terriglobales bacterium]
MSRPVFAAFLLAAALLMVSCGGGTPATLQSLRINQQLTGASATFTATGIYSNGRQVTPTAVSWVNWSVTTFVSGQPRYLLKSSPFVPPCSASGAVSTVAAVAPMDPHAPSTGPIPANVWADLITGKTQSEGGFVGATAQLTCP